MLIKDRKHLPPPMNDNKTGLVGCFVFFFIQSFSTLCCNFFVTCSVTKTLRFEIATKKLNTAINRPISYLDPCYIRTNVTKRIRDKNDALLSFVNH